MLRKTAPMALALALFALAAPSPAAALAEQGPYAGILAQDETRTHTYDNHPPGPEPCPDWFAPIRYTVSLAYAPPTDVLTLQVGDVGTVTGENGQAVLSFEGDGCVRLDLAVTGTSVAARAAYALQVTTGGASDS